MNGLFILLLIGVVLYMLLSKKSGLSRCGGHHDHASHGRGDEDHVGPGRRTRPFRPDGEIIDLKKGDYKVISSESHPVGNHTH